jgi:opacity protein-like surface antigen
MKRIGLVILGFTLFTASARAEVLFTPYAGAAFGGATDKAHGSYGASLAFLGGGMVGFEIDANVVPNFFGGSGDDGDLLSSNNVLSAMGSVVVSSPDAPVRFYGVAGVGLIRTSVEDSANVFDFDSNEFGFNAGGGLVFKLTDNVGLRADLRYFRDFKDNEPDDEFDIDFGRTSYWRATGGVSFRF